MFGLSPDSDQSVRKTGPGSRTEIFTQPKAPDQVWRYGKNTRIQSGGTTKRPGSSLVVQQKYPDPGRRYDQKTRIQAGGTTKRPVSGQEVRPKYPDPGWRYDQKTWIRSYNLCVEGYGRSKVNFLDMCEFYLSQSLKMVRFPCISFL